MTFTILSWYQHWSYFQIAGYQPTRLFQTRYARFQMLKSIKNQFKILMYTNFRIKTNFRIRFDFSIKPVVEKRLSIQLYPWQ